MKRVLACILALVMLFTLAACGSSSSGSTNSGSSSDSGSASAATSDSGSSAASDDTVYELIVQNHDPSSSICAQFIEDWEALVTEASDGRIQFVNYHGGSLGGATETVDMVLNGQADIGWTSSSINVGRMPTSDGIALPMLGFEDTNEAAAVMWYMYENHDYISDEWADYYVIECSAACDVPFTTTKKKVESASDFKGLRMRCVVPGVSYMLQELGCVPMSITISDTYENLEKSVADGCMNDWHNIMAFSLWDVLGYAMDANVSFANQALIMNQAKYDSLPADLQAVIDEYSGEFAAAMAGEYWESSITKSMAIAEESGVEIYEPNDEVSAAMNAAAAVAWDKWAADMDADGYDGSQIVADYQAALEAVRG